MGHDQGNVPLRLLVFVLLTAVSAAQPPSRTRCGFVDHARHDAERASSEQVQSVLRPDLPEFVDAPSGRFRVHYTPTGPDAATSEFVAACIESLERAWLTEVDTLGYRPPPDDGSEGGSGAIDVYIRDLSKAGPGGSSYYGVTRLERRLTGGAISRFTTWIEVDNDFSSSDRDASGNPSFGTFGLDGLRATCAHEFHHTIQNGSYGLATRELSVYELTSTWMEVRVYPTIRDWAIYLSELLVRPSQYPFSSPTQSNGYMWGWFGTAFDQVGSSVLPRTWERIGDGASPFAALSASCVEAGTTVSEVFTTNLPSMYYTGSRGDTNTLIIGADLVPEIHLHEDLRAETPATTSTGLLYPFEVRAIRFLVPSTSGPNEVSTTVLITWADENVLVNGASQSQQPYSVTVTPTPTAGDVLIAGTSWGVRVQPPPIHAFIEGTQTKTVAAPYPQPVRLSEEPAIYIPVSATLSDEVSITLLTTSLIGMKTERTNVMLDGQNVVARMPLPTDLAPGTYLLRVEIGDSTTLVKIAVRR